MQTILSAIEKATGRKVVAHCAAYTAKTILVEFADQGDDEINQAYTYDLRTGTVTRKTS